MRGLVSMLVFVTAVNAATCAITAIETPEVRFSMLMAAVGLSLASLSLLHVRRWVALKEAS